MICPKCGGKTGICDSRKVSARRVRRRRECKVCGERFSTVELPELELKVLRGVTDMIHRRWVKKVDALLKWGGDRGGAE